MTQLSDQDRKAQMADMKSFDEQMPCVGIFWYDMETKSFFGVRKQEVTPKMVEEAAEKGIPFINYPHLHRQVWTKEYFRAQARNEESKFTGDYTQVPRGRVAWNVNKFIVLVGRWAEPIQEELAVLIEQEFSLPYFEFVYDYNKKACSRAMSAQLTTPRKELRKASNSFSKTISIMLLRMVHWNKT